ncbi:hypothetical protein B7P43_G17689 [Cryptotermes secundus]|uniref:Uncharacterized protein n=1 Tax=Cryptotermes secundus TaxID=105785 RepID=A0A2J7QUJ1_9NEOP|nr:hypothetical protein B7P43_G17689 [Cryptotermes secundus]
MEASGQLHVLAGVPLGNNPGTHWTGDWVGSKASVDIVKTRKISSQSRIKSWFSSHPASSRTIILTKLSPRTNNEYVYKCHEKVPN